MKRHRRKSSSPNRSRVDVLLSLTITLLKAAYYDTAPVIVIGVTVPRSFAVLYTRENTGTGSHRCYASTVFIREPVVMFQSGFRKLQIPAKALSLALIGVAWTGDADAKMKAIPLIFGTKESKAYSLKKFKKWTNAIARYAKETPNDL